MKFTNLKKLNRTQTQICPGQKFITNEMNIQVNQQSMCVYIYMCTHMYADIYDMLHMYMVLLYTTLYSHILCMQCLQLISIATIMQRASNISTSNQYEQVSHVGI